MIEFVIEQQGKLKSWFKLLEFKMDYKVSGNVTDARGLTAFSSKMCSYSHNTETGESMNVFISLLV
jgi:hypothetical protein